MVQSTTPRALFELNAKERKDFLKSFDFVFSDCDGVVWLLSEPLPQTGEALNLLKDAGKQVKFVTNNSLTSDQVYFEKFTKIGLKNFQTDDVIQPMKIIIKYLKQHKPNEKVFSIASKAASQTLKEHGIDVETLEVNEHLTAFSLMSYLKTSAGVGAVVFDINLDLRYIQITKAIQYLQQPNCMLICGGTDTHIPLSPTITAPGFIDYLEHIAKYSGKKPKAFGKPSEFLGLALKDMFKITDPKRCLFIGDSLTQDIAFGKKCGFQTLLVLSGATKLKDLNSANDDMLPDFYTNGLKDFLQIFDHIKNDLD